jgi:GNAT superfamily N-acetyltransferase
MEEFSVSVQRLVGADDAQQAYCCMTEVPTPWPQALCQCREWVARNLGKHIEGFHVQLESGEVAGHLYYALSEKALIPYEIEERVGVLYCEWVQRRYQGQGLGQRLFTAFRDEMDRQAVKGVLVENTETDGEGHLKRYLGLGFKVVSESERGRLLYLPINQGEVEVSRLKARIVPRQGVPVEILVIGGYMCPYEAATLLLLEEVSREFGERVKLHQVPLTRETLGEYGVARGIFINGRPKLAGAETEESVRQAIQEAL